MDIFIIIVQLLAGGAGLHFGAEWLVRGSGSLALTLGIKPLIIGVTLVAFGTSAPEGVVSVSAALGGDIDISIGNVMGSNIANIGLAIGLTALIKPLNVGREVFKRDMPMMLLATVGLIVLLFIGGTHATEHGEAYRLSWWKGAIMLASIAGFMGWVIRDALKGRHDAADELPDDVHHSKRVLYTAMALLGLAVLLAGGYFFVEGAVELAQFIGVPAMVIALSVVAFGTSLPEIITSLVANLRGQSDIGIGNVVGSNIFNILLVLGIVALIAPIHLDVASMRVDIPVMLGFALFLAGVAFVFKKIGRVAGLIMVLVYSLYTANLFFRWVT